MEGCMECRFPLFDIDHNLVKLFSVLEGRFFPEERFWQSAVSVQEQTGKIMD
jgi:hypothetical protein